APSPKTCPRSSPSSAAWPPSWASPSWRTMPDLRFAAPVERRAALITGGARGIGAATAIRLAEAGRDIVIADVLPDEAAQTVAQITALGQRAVFMHTDVADPPSMQQ